MLKKITILVAVVALLLTLGCECSKKEKACSSKGGCAITKACQGEKMYTGQFPFNPVAMPKNEDFYNEDGSLNADKVRDAYFAMMKAFAYPIPQSLEDGFWSADFLSGEFAKVGMGGIFWVNEKGKYGETGAGEYDGEYAGQQFGYLGHDIYLLPGQTLPEHNHEGGLEDYAPKMEAWKITNGEVTFFAEFKGEGMKDISELPVENRPYGYGEPWFKCNYYITKVAGEYHVMADPESWHGQMAGPNGAIVAEFATYHNGVAFSKPGAAFDSTKAKK